MKIILDTNVLSELMKSQGSQLVKSWVAAQPRESLFITTVTQAEILYGIKIMPRGKRSKRLQTLAELMFLEDFAGQILTFDQPAAVHFAEIAACRKTIGKPISQFDAQIAAICLQHKAILATRNVDDFLDCGINIINPWDISSYN